MTSRSALLPLLLSAGAVTYGMPMDCPAGCYQYNSGCFLASKLPRLDDLGCDYCPGSRDAERTVTKRCSGEGKELIMAGESDASSPDPCATKCKYTCNVTEPRTTAPYDTSYCCSGFEGAACGHQIDACFTTPCSENALCVDKPPPSPGDESGRSCKCWPGYSNSACAGSDTSECCPDTGDQEFVKLNQRDFAHGTYIIDKPGRYVLQEDISFNPNPRVFGGNGMPWPDQFEQYDQRAYSLGFFAAISVTAERVEIDLNGFTLEQSEEHALQQRWFALIELGNVPFHYDHGPHNFTNKNRVQSAKQVRIKNGVLGRSSHHGIHGVGPQDIEIVGLTIREWEVAGISINGGINIKVDQTMIGPSRRDVPVVGLFSTGVFIRPYVIEVLNSCDDTTIDIYNNQKKVKETKTGRQILDELDGVLNATFDAVVHNIGKVPEIVSNYVKTKQNGNRNGLPDGSALYGMVFATYGTHTMGFAMERDARTCLDPLGEVVGMVQEADTAVGSHRCQTDRGSEYISSGNENIRISNVRIFGLQLDVNEVAALKTDNHNKGSGSDEDFPQVDFRGAVYQYEANVDSEFGSKGSFMGNPISNAQLFAAKHKKCIADKQTPPPQCPVTKKTATTRPPVGSKPKKSPGCKHSQLVPEGLDLAGKPEELGLELSTIRDWTFKWAAEGGDDLDSETDEFLICGGDNMFHVNKGIHGIRVDAGDGFVFKNVEISTIKNKARQGSSLCGASGRQHPQASEHLYLGGDSTGITLAASRDIKFDDVVVEAITSEFGNAYGVNLLFDTTDVRGVFNAGLVKTDYGTKDVPPSKLRPPVRLDHKDPIANVLEMHRMACRPGDGANAMMGMGGDQEGMDMSGGAMDDATKSNGGITPLDPNADPEGILCSLSAHVGAFKNTAGEDIPEPQARSYTLKWGPSQYLQHLVDTKILVDINDATGTESSRMAQAQIDQAYEQLARACTGAAKAQSIAGSSTTRYETCVKLLKELPDPAAKKTLKTMAAEDPASISSNPDLIKEEGKYIDNAVAEASSATAASSATDKMDSNPDGSSTVGAKVAAKKGDADVSITVFIAVAVVGVLLVLAVSVFTLVRGNGSGSATPRSIQNPSFGQTAAKDAYSESFELEDSSSA